MSEQWHRVAEFPAGFDLRILEARLGQASIDYLLLDEGPKRVLLIPDHEQAPAVLSLIQDTLAHPAGSAGSGTPLFKGLSAQFQRTPVMVICLLLSIAGAGIVRWQFQWLHWLTFQDFFLISYTDIRFASFGDAMAQGQYWRLITPIFLHFGIFHVAFNGLWLWEFGRRIEAVAGSGHFLLLVLFTGVVSNYSQYLWEGPSLFGGMSGVLYALLGYLWIRNRLAPNPALTLPRGIIGFMLVWLVLCMTGIIDLIMSGSIANAAHASGLVAGMVLGAFFGISERYRRL